MEPCDSAHFSGDYKTAIRGQCGLEETVSGRSCLEALQWLISYKNSLEILQETGDKQIISQSWILAEACVLAH